MKTTYFLLIKKQVVFWEINKREGDPQPSEQDPLSDMQFVHG